MVWIGLPLTLLLWSLCCQFLPAQGVNFSERCSADRQFRLRVFAQWTRRRFLHNTGCPTDHLWLTRMRDLDPIPGKVFLNLGFNKGYNFANWANLWAPEAQITPKKWMLALKETSRMDGGDKALCGVCADCMTEFVSAPHSAPDGQTKMFGIDINRDNIAMGMQASNKLVPEALKDRVQMKLIHAAAGNQSGQVWITNCNFGDESCAIIPPAQYARHGIPADGGGVGHAVAPPNVHSIPLISVDGFLSKHSVSTIDIVMTDTEGNDPAVIQGALRSLAAGQIRVYVFEYHSAGMWKDVELKDVIQMFDKFDYECFLEGYNLVYPLSGDCWEDVFAFKRWANVICIRRGDVWLQAVAPFSEFTADTKATFLMP